MRSHIDGRKEQVSAKILSPEGGGLLDPTSIGERNESQTVDPRGE